MLNDKKSLRSTLLFMITNLLQIFIKKPNLFNSFLAKQCSIIKNNSLLTSSTNPITDQYLTNIEFTKDDNKRTIRKLDPNKAHGHIMVSIIC